MTSYTLIRSNRKTIALQIDENAKLIVRAPYRVSQKRIDQFILEKREWIKKTQKKAAHRKQLMEENSEFKDGKLVMFLGKEYRLILNDKIKAIELTQDIMRFPLAHIEGGEEYLSKWYKKKAKEIIIPRVERYALALGFSYKRIGITSAKKRWGSCNSKGSINFTYRLVMTPPEIIDYVIVHELMHLREMNHSAKFWSHVAQIIPDYKKRRKWLKDNQHRIQI